MEHSQTEFSSQKNKALNSIHGNIYRLKLLLLFLYRGLSHRYSFRLCTVIEEAENFDDLVFEYTLDGKKVYRLLQVKHKLDEETKKISAHNLLREKNGAYNLLKYFKSYQSSKKSDLFKDGSIKDVIICTNIDFDFENLKREHIQVEKIEDKDDILDTESGEKQHQCYRFKPDLAYLKEMTEFSAHEVKNFLDHLVFAVNQPNPDELGKIMKEELGEKYDFDLIKTENVYNKFLTTMSNWFLYKDRNTFFSWEEGKELFEEAKRRMPIRFSVKDPTKSFVGRTEQLCTLHKLLQNATVVSQVVAITGPGGIGKSELVRKYINEHSQDYDNKVVWINAENYQTLAGSFRRLARDRLGICTTNVKGNECVYVKVNEISSIVADVYKFFSGGGKSLFVFDNAKKYESQYEFDDGIEKFLISRPPNSNGPCILITSRNQKWPSAIIKTLALDAFTEEESTKFVKTFLDIENDAQEKEIKELSKELQHFPLALQQAVSYIKVEDEMLRNVGLGFKISDFLQRFKVKKTELLNFEFPGNSDNEYTKTTYMTCDVTLDAIRQDKKGDKALEMLNVISYLAAENIPTKILLIFSKDEKHVGSIIELLKQYSMVYAEQGRLHVHRLLQQVIRDKLRKQNREEEVLKNILKLFSEVDMCSETVNHAIFAWNYSSKYGKLIESFFFISSYISNAFIDSGRHEEAHLFGLKVLELLHTLPLDNQTIQICTLVTEQDKARIYLEQGKYDIALKAFQKVLDAQIITTGQYNPLFLKTKHNMATALFRIGKYDEGLMHFQNLLDLSKITLGEEDPETLKTIHCVATGLLSIGRFHDALHMFQELHDIQKVVLGENHSDTLTTKESIARALRRLDKDDEALQIFREIYNLQKAKLEKNHPDILGTKERIANVLLNQYKYNDAFEIYHEVLNVKRESLGKNHPEVSIIRHQLAVILQRQSKYGEALKAFREIFDEQKHNLGYDNPIALITQRSIATTLDEQGKSTEALQVYQEVLNRSKVILGNDHIDTLEASIRIAQCFSKHGNFDKALEYYQEILIAQKKVFGETHFETLTTKNNIGIIYHKKREYDRALPILQGVYNVQQLLFPNDPRTLITKMNIADALVGQGRDDEALKMFREILVDQETVVEKKLSEIIPTKNRIAKILIRQGKYREAIRILQEVFKGCNTIFGPEHLETLTVGKIIQQLKMQCNPIPAEALITAVNNNDLKTIESLAKNDIDVNIKDEKDRTLLHHAVSNCNVDIVKFLLKNGADVTQVTNKGNTPLHIATLKGLRAIVEILLEHASHNRLNDFIDAKTAVGSTTSLHVAVKNGFSEIVISLLKHGATYNIKNKEGKTPLELSQKQDVTNLLKIIEELFEHAKIGSKAIINKLKAMKPDNFTAATNARNNYGHTLSQVLIHNRHRNIARSLLEMLKKSE